MLMNPCFLVLWMQIEREAEIALACGQNKAEFCLRHQAFGNLRANAFMRYCKVSLDAPDRLR